MKNYFSALSTLTLKLKQQGVGPTARLAVGRIGSQARSMFEDMRRGVSTAREVPDHALEFEEASNHAYVATDYSAIRRALDSIDIRPQQDVFADIGCGKGRVIVIASQYPFRRVIGVELSDLLLDVARQNMGTAAKRKCGEIELVLADATSWEIPADANVLFFFNPFDGEVLSRVCANIRSSLATSPRKLTIIYVRPDKFFEREINWRDWLTTKTEFPYSDGKVAIYESR